ncbi:LysR family transcriptional regulator [Prauserella muralis]|uniref:LysR family transcriptional regulator n=1 Tax=Prauserella muralis TaxID=588067 RepID=A0A2V4BCY6_9PSEU|nr:LysR family transcriptional regulator [Prauserella muralis]PXY32372.1 LysR family transcriptional regulator [Prauserella muralis]TWE23942.1 DNA-binding transcriptional LysR family regulator [Prauserella muralis]
MLDVARLRLLRAVVATGSIRASAEVLGYTPSAVSQQLTALQRETGLRLFERVGRGIEPTAAGRTLATESGALFEALSHVEGVVDDLRNGRVGRLSLGYFGSAGSAWLPPVVATLRAEFPELRLDLRMTENPEPGESLPDIDIFVERPDGRRPAGAEVRRLADDPYLAVVRADDPLAARGEVPLADLAGQAWIDNDLGKGACRQVLLDSCAEAGFSPRFVVEANDYATAIPFVATGIGLTVIPALGIADLPEELTTVRIVSPTPVRHISVAVRQSIAGHPAAVRALEVLEKVVSDS